MTKQYMWCAYREAPTLDTVSQMLKGCTLSGTLTTNLFDLLIWQAQQACPEQSVRVLKRAPQAV